MAADVLKYTSGNSASTTSSSSISNSDTALPLTSDTNFAAKSGEGMVIIDEGAATEEFAYATGKSGASLTIPLVNRGLEGGSAQAHDSNATVKGILTAGMWNSLVDSLTNVVSKVTGALDTTKVVDLTTAQTLTNKTLTSPKFNEDVALTATSTELNQLHGVSLYSLPEGTMFNGKIVPSVASNNLTVALKTLAGTDPSASDPVYVRIGDTVRSITSALSVTLNAGTNWSAAGSSELAAKEIDWFAYLFYRSGDGGVSFCISRVPYMTLVSHAAGDATSYNSLHASTGSLAASDDGVVIGRFAATLSAGAGYTWSVPTYTSNNLVQKPTRESRWLTWLPTYTADGSMTYTSTSTGYYKVIGEMCEIGLRAQGTTGVSANNQIYATLPFATPSTADTGEVVCTAVIDNSASKGGLTRDTGVAGKVGVQRYDAGNFTIGANEYIFLAGRLRLKTS